MIEKIAAEEIAQGLIACAPLVKDSSSAIRDNMQPRTSAYNLGSPMPFSSSCE